VVLRSGVTADHLLGIAEEERADLIVLGWSQTLSPGRAEVVRALLERSPVPLLLVPVPTPVIELRDAPVADPHAVDVPG
jgi:hypothetical protein